MLRIIFFVFAAVAMQATAFELILPEPSQRLSENHSEGYHRLAQGRIRGVNNRWQFEKESYVSGPLYSATWQLDDSVNYTDTANYFKRWVAQQDATIVFECRGRSCGASNIWANNYFQDWRLYGPDDKQFLWLLQRDQQYYMLYLIERGNRKVYLHELKIDVEAASSRSVMPLLDEQCPNQPLEVLSQNDSWLLFVSVVNDETQQQSLKKGEACLQQLQKLHPSTKLELVALGQRNRYWQKVKANQFELVAHD